MVYTHSKSDLNQIILAKPPVELVELLKLALNTVILVVKPLYGIPEAGNHWYKTYSNHHRDKLHMDTSTYDPCLLVSTTPNAFALLVLQTDDSLFVASPEFANIEETEL